jgi:predicted secreted hydrolase
MIFDVNKIRYHVVISLIIINLVSCGDAVPPDRYRPDVLPGASRLSDLLGADDRLGFPLVLSPRSFEFPADHGPHNEFRNEWWYVTGNLIGPNNALFGYELTFFRFSLTPQITDEKDSAWQTNQVFIAHFAITDVTGDEFHVAQRYSRGGAGLAGANGDPFRVWLDDWSIRQIDQGGDEPIWQLTAHGDGVDGEQFGVELQLSSRKPPILNGIDGLSQKSAEAGNASYYYSLSRLKSEGSVNIGATSYAVSGFSWLDREWGSSALSAEQQGWDWFALQLSDGNELMFYDIRRNDGSSDRHSAGTWIDSTGNPLHLERQDVSINVFDTWVNDRGDVYPAKWQITIPSRDVSLTVTPVLENQELITNVRYWEGAVDVTGSNGNRSVTGRGYVELTGYADR